MGDDLTWHAEAEHDNQVADANARIVHAIQRHGADVREDSDASIRVPRQYPVTHKVASRDMVRPMSPH